MIIVSNDQADWLPACLPTIFARSGSISLDLVVVDNGSTRATRDLVERDFPAARVIVCPNRGFAHANNEALRTVEARYVLFLNPDTELLEGTLGELLAELDRRPDVGLAGVRQIDADGRVYPTMRRFPSVARAVGDALGLERLTVRPGSLGERELVSDRYDHEFESDWTIGSFMLARREALAAVRWVRRAFLRLLGGGRSLPAHQARRLEDRSSADDDDPASRQHRARARCAHGATERLCAAAVRGEALRRAERAGYRAALLLRYGLRSLPPAGDADRRSAARAAAALVLGRAEPPFGKEPR